MVDFNEIKRNAGARARSGLADVKRALDRSSTGPDSSQGSLGSQGSPGAYTAGQAQDRYAAQRQRVYQLIEVGRGEDGWSRWFDIFLIALIIANIIAFTLETVPSIEAEYGAALRAFDVISVLIFTLEYAARIWSCVEVPFLRRLPPLEARMRFAMRPYLLIDLLAILPFYLAFLIPVDLRVLRVFRLLRFLKLARYSPAMHTLLRVLTNERRALLGALLLMIMMLLVSATGIYYLERSVQPEKFGSIPEAAWWAMATLTTVGYGDVAPISPMGKFFGIFVMILGVGMFALPVAIISTGFAQEVGRRDFVVTWSMMARIPLLAELDANSVAWLMPYLHAHNFPAHWEVVAAGVPATGMYFIASGQVRLKNPGTETLHSTGDFFGEIAMLEGSNYQYSFITGTRCRLLKLNKDDFDRIANAHPEITNHIRAVADARKAARAAGERDPAGVAEGAATSVATMPPLD